MTLYIGVCSTSYVTGSPCPICWWWRQHCVMIYVTGLFITYISGSTRAWAEKVWVHEEINTTGETSRWNMKWLFSGHDSALLLWRNGVKWNEMHGVLGHDSAYVRLYWAAGKPGLLSRILIMNYTTGAGSIARPVDLQSSTLSNCYQTSRWTLTP